jgi:hypothetical protein
MEEMDSAVEAHEDFLKENESTFWIYNIDETLLRVGNHIYACV